MALPPNFCDVVTIQTGIITSVAAIADVAVFSLVQKVCNLPVARDLGRKLIFLSLNQGTSMFVIFLCLAF